MRDSLSIGGYPVGAPAAVMAWGRLRGRRFASIIMMLCSLMLVSIAHAQDASPEASATGPGSESSAVMKDFVALEQANRVEGELTTKEKHTIMFIMGVLLLVLLLATAYFGIAMAVMGKPLFIPHMLCAGLSVTLAIAHSVVAIVWFYPF